MNAISLLSILRSGTGIAAVGGATAISPWLGALAILAIVLCKALDKAPEIIRALRSSGDPTSPVDAK